MDIDTGGIGQKGIVHGVLSSGYRLRGIVQEGIVHEVLSKGYGPGCGPRVLSCFRLKLDL